jgi:Flp pilus assembly protein TadG
MKIVWATAWARRRYSVRTGEGGSAIAEFVMVVSLLTLLTLAVMQLALTLHIRNTVHDAAAEGARFAALAGNTAVEGTGRTRDLISSALGARFSADVTASIVTVSGVPSVAVRVRAPLPIFGLLGPQRGLEVTGRGALESLG